MSLSDRIGDDFISAMKNQEAEKLSVLRMLKSALQNEKIKIGHDLSDEEIVKVIQSQIKQRKDSIETFAAGGRTELADKEKVEIEILSAYMPEQLSDSELTSIVKAAIETTGATTAADMGKVMGNVMPQVAGRADGGQISAKVKELLS
ncbi:MAG: GatB/YqeY domain-containing protein [Candidatus Berkelbacteria bacterium]